MPAQRRGGINIARVNLSEQSDLCRPDGRDIRVLTPNGEVLPREVRIRKNRSLSVLFPVVRDADAYHIYYANPDAEPPEREWPARRTGGLTLETRPLRRPVREPAELKSRWEEVTESFGSRSWGRVYDLENPFGRDDFYISLYEGTLYCPESGRYIFSVNADDSAGLWIEGREKPLCLRAPGIPSSGL